MDRTIGSHNYTRAQLFFRRLGRRLRGIGERRRASARGIQVQTLTGEIARLRAENIALVAARNGLTHQLEERDAVLSALNEGAMTLHASLGLNEVLTSILRQLEHVIKFDSASIFLVEEEQLRLIATRGLPAPRGSLSIPIAQNPLAQRLLESDEPLIIGDVQAVKGLIEPQSAEVRSWIGAVLRIGDRRVGVLSIDHHEPNAYTARDAMLVASYARQAALALHSAQLYAEAQRRAAETELLLELTRAVGSTLYLPEVLLRAAGAIAEATGAADVLLLLLDDNGTLLMPQAGTSTGEPMLRRIWPASAPLSAEPLLEAVLSEQRARLLSLTDPQIPARWRSCAEPAGLHSLILLPLVFKERALGLVIAGINGSNQPYAPARPNLVEGLVTSAALAIEHARLFEQARRAAIFEERSRLARELHDSVTQALFSITLTAQAASGQVPRNQDRALEQLQRLQSTAHQALGEMRDLLLQLRPISLREGGLGQALREHIARISCQGGPTISLIISGDEHLISGKERGLYRITQEALSNALRHANASRIEVDLMITNALLRLEVRDNGCGFNPQAGSDPRRQLGLRSMAERAAEMNGKLILQSHPDAGTTVAVEVPLTPLESPVSSSAQS